MILGWAEPHLISLFKISDFLGSFLATKLTSLNASVKGFVITGPYTLTWDWELGLGFGNLTLDLDFVFVPGPSLSKKYVLTMAFELLNATTCGAHKPLEPKYLYIFMKLYFSEWTCPLDHWLWSSSNCLTFYLNSFKIICPAFCQNMGLWQPSLISLRMQKWPSLHQDGISTWSPSLSTVNPPAAQHPRPLQNSCSYSFDSCQWLRSPPPAATGGTTSSSPTNPFLTRCSSRRIISTNKPIISTSSRAAVSAVVPCPSTSRPVVSAEHEPTFTAAAASNEPVVLQNYDWWILWWAI